MLCLSLNNIPTTSRRRKCQTRSISSHLHQELTIEQFVNQLSSSLQAAGQRLANDNDIISMGLQQAVQTRQKKDTRKRDKKREKRRRERNFNKHPSESLRRQKKKRHLSLHVPRCQPQRALTDLGQGHYPRLLTTAVCGQESCGSNPMLSCVESGSYSVSVLMANTSQQCGDARLPPQLREDWTLRDVSLSTGCNCVT